jgi:hypothetical protein
MSVRPEVQVTLSDELLDVLQDQARLLRVPLRWLIASLICDTIDTVASRSRLPIRQRTMMPG